MVCQKTTERIVHLLRQEDGAAAIEYAVMLALIVGVMISGVTYFGNEVKALKDVTANALDSSLTPDE